MTLFSSNSLALDIGAFHEADTIMEHFFVFLFFLSFLKTWLLHYCQSLSVSVFWLVLGKLESCVCHA